MEIIFDEPLNLKLDVDMMETVHVTGSDNQEHRNLLKRIAFGEFAVFDINDMLRMNMIDHDDIRDMFVVSEDHAYKKCVDHVKPPLMCQEVLLRIARDNTFDINAIFNARAFPVIFNQYLTQIFGCSRINVGSLELIKEALEVRNVDPELILLIDKRLNFIKNSEILFLSDIRCGEDVRAYFEWRIDDLYSSDNRRIMHTRLQDLKEYDRYISKSDILMEGIDVASITSQVMVCEAKYTSIVIELMDLRQGPTVYYRYMDALMGNCNPQKNFTQECFNLFEDKYNRLSRILTTCRLNYGTNMDLTKRIDDLHNILVQYKEYATLLFNFTSNAPANLLQVSKLFFIGAPYNENPPPLLTVFAFITHDMNVKNLSMVNIRVMQQRMHIIYVRFNQIIFCVEESREALFPKKWITLSLCVVEASKLLNQLILRETTKERTTYNLSKGLVSVFLQSLINNAKTLQEIRLHMIGQGVKSRDKLEFFPRNVVLDLSIYAAVNLFEYNTKTIDVLRILQAANYDYSTVTSPTLCKFVSAKFDADDLVHLSSLDSSKLAHENMALFFCDYIYRFAHIYHDTLCLVQQSKPSPMSELMDGEVAMCIRELSDKFYWKPVECNCSIRNIFNKLGEDPWKTMRHLQEKALQCDAIPNLEYPHLVPVIQRFNDNDACDCCKHMIIIMLYVIYFSQY